jgi:hypothetical protein
MKLNLIVFAVIVIAISFLILSEQSHAEEAYVQELGTYDGIHWNYRAIGTEVNAKPAPLDSSITALTYDGNPQIFYFGTDLTVHQIYWTGSAFGYNSLNFPVQPTISASSGLTSVNFISGFGPGQPNVYYIGNDRKIYDIHYDGSTWWRQTLFATGVMLSSDSGIASMMWNTQNLAREMAAFYFGDGNPDHRPQWLDYSAPVWTYRNIGAVAGAPNDPSYRSTAITSLEYNNYPRVYYTEDLVGYHNAQIKELGYQSDGTWFYHNHAQQYQAEGSVGSLASTRVDGNPRIYYIGSSNNMIRELGTGDDISWMWIVGLMRVHHLLRAGLLWLQLR